MDNMECKLHIWDTADFKLNSNIPLSLYDGVLGFIIVYDITRRVRFNQFRIPMISFLASPMKLPIGETPIGKYF